jgi:hypothetical protein
MADAELPNRPRRRSRLGWTLALLIGLALLGTAVRQLWWDVFPRALQTIEEGLYRSARLERWPYGRVIRDRAIRTVLRLDDVQPPHEAGIAGAHGVQVLVVPMNGDGTAPFEDLDKAADIVADRTRRPLLFHCVSGSRRSSAVQAAFRMKHCGWSWERTARELAEFGLRREDSPPLYAHLERYDREHLRREGEGTK